MKWYSVKERMPGVDMDVAHNKQARWLNCFFLVCYHHGDGAPFYARAFLKDGKFITDEWCRSYENCPDERQEKYWEGNIVTHWALIFEPDDLEE